MKRSLTVLALGLVSLWTLVVVAPVVAQTTTSDVPDLNLPWPFDFKVKEGTYSRDIVFNAQAANEYLDRAKKTYIMGYDLVKKYQGVKDNPDPFVRDPYRVYVREIRNLSFRNDFSGARNYFLEAYNIITEGLQWDVTMRQRADYKDLLKKILKGLIQMSIYMKELFTANDYLDTYVSLYPDDKAFITEYRVRIITMLVDQQEMHPNMWSGEKSPDALRLKYQMLVQQYVADRTDLDAKTKAWIIDRAAPKWSTKDFNTKSIDTNYGK